MVLDVDLIVVLMICLGLRLFWTGAAVILAVSCSFC